MLNRIRSLVFIFALLFFGFQVFDGTAQDKNRNKKAWPDSLASVTLEGTVIIDDTHENIYFLDIDGDDVADYKLAFGPDWYVPESGAERPVDGDQVTIVGSINPKPAVPIVIVFEINGLIWREAVENWWRHQDWCDSLTVVTVTGTVMVDTTYFYLHYYLDEDGDGEPDYFLSFGPPWYEPESGATRPENGETVTLEGALKEGEELPRLVVSKIDDLLWRELQGPAPWSGGWIGKEQRRQRRIHSPIDSLSWAEFPPGAMKGGGHQGPRFPDSLFCEFMNVWADSLPGRPDSAFAGWHFFFSNPNGKMHHGKGRGRAVRFLKRLRMQLNICTGDSGGPGLGKATSENYTLMYWDDESSTWLPVENTTYDALTQSFSFEPEDINSYYAVFSSTGSVTSVNENTGRAAEFSLHQNYPNPFNPETTIAYDINRSAMVTLSIFNVLGQKVRNLVNEFKENGQYQTIWDGRDELGNALPSGFYIYQLKVGNQTEIRRMLMMK
ncbi:T9SS type A sorting domain-containing protein [candidate division KSB1 bacterium]|nr:T9SS type A sorting domain-containing protein [candidate division KSB1 bacterium]